MRENWLFIKTPDQYGNPEIIEFDDNIINHFHVENTDGALTKIATENRKEKLNEVEHKFINPNRIRFFRNGKIQ